MSNLKKAIFNSVLIIIIFITFPAFVLIIIIILAVILARILFFTADFWAVVGGPT